MTDRTLLAQALAALEDGTFDRAHWITALRSALAAPQPEPVALESVHLTRDTQGMCVVRVNGRVAIRDNGDIIDHMATLEWFATPPAAPAEPCYCDRMGIGVPGVSCGDCPRDYKPAAPAPDVPMTDEQQIAIREAHCNTASDEYFGARPHIDSREDRRIYEAGFKEGWESAHGIGGGGNHG